MEPDERWELFDVTQQYLQEMAEWMSRDPHCPGTVIMYFQTAGSLIRLAWFDYKLIGSALFLTISGFEGVLRLCFDDKDASFNDLIARALSEAIISDRTFTKIAPVPKELLKRMERGQAPYREKLMNLIRKLRNSYFHGEYILFPECLQLAIQMREAADAVLAHRGWTEAR